MRRAASSVSRSVECRETVEALKGLIEDTIIGEAVYLQALLNHVSWFKLGEILELKIGWSFEKKVA